MSWKRLLSLVALVVVAAAVLVSAAPAGGIRDWEPCPDSGGLLTCPPGQEGIPYSIKFRSVEEPVCRPGDDTWHIINGSAPPGLSLGLEGTLSGTPTAAGSYRFWVEMRLPDIEGICNGTADTSQEEFSITIVPGVPRLIIGPESAPPGTVNSQYSLQMTATVADQKTWSIVDGALPPGVALGPNDGLISGTPTAEGTYSFMVRAAVTADARADTKVLGIVVRRQLAIAAGVVPPSEVGVPFAQTLTASGGTETFTWSVSAGALPAGLALGPTGTISGTPTSSGNYRFTVSAVDTEGRTARLNETLKVAARVGIDARSLLRPAREGRFYQARLKTTGGVQPATWKLKRGPLPRGIFFDRSLGLFYGSPTKAGRYRVVVEVRDALRVTATQTVVLVVRAAAKKRTT